MSTYNLSDNVQENFNFELRGKKYVMRYPRTNEIEQVQNIMAEHEEARKNKDEDAAKAANNKLEDYLYGFITPEGHETPIKEALDKENIRVMRNFNKMIKTELSIS